MEHEINRSREERVSTEARRESPYILPAAIVVAAVMISGTWVYSGRNPSVGGEEQASQTSVAALIDEVVPAEGVQLPATWGDLGAKLVSVGAIDGERFRALYEQRGQFTDELKDMLFGSATGAVTITRENADYLLNLFWALGLASSNPVLDFGEMMDPQYGGAQNFASTGGWTLARGDAMDHYSMHTFFELTPEQQTLVEKVSRGIFRPCCGNSTHFPDCNHGMAMLGLLQLLAWEDATEREMWDAALAVNSYWFPDTYMTVATYMQQKGTDWNDVDPVQMLSADFSSSAGYARVASQVVRPEQQRGGGGCSV